MALFGGMGMGKTAFVRGMAAGFGLKAEVSSPTFSLVNEYGGHPPFVHFDMYRVSGWDDLMTTGFFDYLDSGAVIAVEWSERIDHISNLRRKLPDRKDGHPWFKTLRGRGYLMVSAS